MPSSFWRLSGAIDRNKTGSLKYIVTLHHLFVPIFKYLFAPKSNFPDSDFSQQRMKAVHPVLTAGTVMPYFLIIGIAFVGIGIGMIIVSDQTKELVR